MDWGILFLIFAAADAQAAMRRTSRSFANGHIIIKNTSNEIIKVSLEWRVEQKCCFTRIVSDESVVNGGTYELLYIRGIYILDDAQRSIQPSSNDLWKEIKTLKTSLKQVSEQVEDFNPKSFPRFYVWKSGNVANESNYPMMFNEVEYNDGNMYDVKSGKATIQDDGMYIFGTSVYTKPDSGRVGVSIYINGKVFARATELDVRYPV